MTFAELEEALRSLRVSCQLHWTSRTNDWTVILIDADLCTCAVQAPTLLGAFELAIKRWKEGHSGHKA